MPNRAIRAIQEFLRLESAAGLILVATAVLAIIVDNSALAPAYRALLDTPMSVRIGGSGIEEPLLLWVNDGLMAVFFLLVGLEMKREMLEGELSQRAQAVLPFVAAMCGIAAPAGIYVGLSSGDPAALRGWAIASATDIAFALGLLSLLGSRIPLSLKVFLTAVAVLDDLGAIIIIAAFYTMDLSLPALATAAAMLAVLIALNRAGVVRLAPYLLVGAVLWFCVLESGVHATLAGVALGLCIPLGNKDGTSPLRDLEHALHPWVAFGILPVFAFANAGVSLADVRPSDFASPVPLGIACGLFLGKQIGIFGAVALMVRTQLARLPEGATWPMVYGIALLCGIGFTMSLFIGTLAFPDPGQAVKVRIGVIAGSLLSAAAGYLVLRRVTRPA